MVLKIFWPYQFYILFIIIHQQSNESSQVIYLVLIEYFLMNLYFILDFLTLNLEHLSFKQILINQVQVYCFDFQYLYIYNADHFRCLLTDTWFLKISLHDLALLMDFLVNFQMGSILLVCPFALKFSFADLKIDLF